METALLEFLATLSSNPVLFVTIIPIIGSGYLVRYFLKRNEKLEDNDNTEFANKIKEIEQRLEKHDMNFEKLNGKIEKLEDKTADVQSSLDKIDVKLDKLSEMVYKIVGTCSARNGGNGGSGCS